MSEHRGVALEALRSYDVTPQRVRLAAESFNSLFRVTTAAAVYALRVGSVLQIHPEGTAAVEAAWHRRLRLQGVYVPDVVANMDGEFATLVTDDRAEHKSRVCILFEWVAGLCEDRALLHAMGECARKLAHPGAARRAAQILIDSSLEVPKQ